MTRRFLITTLVFLAVVGTTALLGTETKAVAAGPLYVPFKTSNWSVRSGWSCADPAHPWTSHCAWDLYAPANTSGGTQVAAAASGTAYVHTDSYFTEDNKCLARESWGRWVEIRHDNGLRTYYAHLRSFAPGIDGTRVSAGQVIGTMGNAGCATGTHLHFEVHDSSGRAVNPGDPRSCSASSALWASCPAAIYVGAPPSGGGPPASSGGDHFYTTSVSEPANAVASGYRWEGIAAYISPGPVSGWVPLYRLWSSSGSDHFYTTSAGERDSAAAGGYSYEGVAGYVSPTPGTGLIPLYRLWSSSGSDHFYTTSAGERDSAAANGYVYEGVAGYVLAGAASGLVPFFRWWLP
jgi:hypothetical protein